MSSRLLLSALLLLSACHPRAAAPTTPVDPIDDELPTLYSCWNGGDVLYKETTRSLDRRGEAAGVLTIYESGAWQLEGGRREARGCLRADEVEVLEARLQTVKRQAPDSPMCSYLPDYDTLVEVPGVGALSYRWPCSPGPDETTAAGIELARDLTWRRSDPATGAS